MPVHLNGLPASMKEIKRLLGNKLKIVEDSAKQFYQNMRINMLEQLEM